MIRRLIALAACVLSILLAANATAQSIPEDECSSNVIPATTPSSDFTLIGNGSIVRHETTGLEWQRCAFGQSWDGSTCQGSAEWRAWQGALNVAADAGGDWRLPDINELRSIAERCRHDPAINRQVFPNTPSSLFWSASPAARYSDGAWFVSFRNGNNSRIGRSQGLWVRLVRGGQ